MKICSRKTCKHKGKPQPESNFTKRDRAADGLRPDCNDCYHEMQQTGIRGARKEREFYKQFSPI